MTRSRAFVGLVVSDVGDTSTLGVSELRVNLVVVAGSSSRLRAAVVVVHMRLAVARRSYEVC